MRNMPYLYITHSQVVHKLAVSIIVLRSLYPHKELI